MNKRYSHGLLALTVMFLVSACTPYAREEAAASTAAPPTMAATSAPTLSLSQLLSGALSSLLAGNYEEAILAYTAIIDIEPKNFDAHLGLGKSYRAAKRPDAAVTALETARALRADDRELLVELGHAYLDTGSYALAEGITRPLWEGTTPDMDAGVVLLLSLIAQERIEDAQGMMRDEAFAEYSAEQFGEEIVYLGEYNEAGERHGKGIGLYSDGFIYIGDYKNSMRSGEGVWYSSVFPGFFTGEWEDDSPNGYGKIYFDDHDYWAGFFHDGLEDGEMRQYCSNCEDMHKYNSVHGTRQRILISNVSNGYGENNAWGSYLQCPRTHNFWPCRIDRLCGVFPWADRQGYFFWEDLQKSYKGD